MSLTAGTRLGPYEVIGPLGAGGMGEVHLALDTRLDRKVAIKLLLAGKADRGVSPERFQSEAKAVSSLNHPNICALYDVGEQNGRDYLVMELVEGETIARRLMRGPLPPDQILRHAIEIAEALDHAHRRGIVHRDLKPGNVMLTKSGAKLLDFGLAKWHSRRTDFQESVETTTREPLTGDGQVVGTLRYMAPEQLEGKPVDARTDLFAFGALVHEMATGRRAFEATSEASLVAAILETDPPSISSLQPLSPPALDRVVKKCLAKDPDERWQSARDLADALKWISHDSSQSGALPSGRLATVVAAGASRRLIAGAAIVLLAAVAGVGWWIWRQTAPPLQATDLRLISTFSGEHWGASFSPDGNFIAFLKEVEGTPQIWVKNLAEGDPIQVTFGDVPVRRLVWSPLNDRIVFSRFRAGLWSVAPLGGSARRILEFGDAPKFSTDGRRLVFARGSGIWTANADGGDVREVSGVPSTPWGVDRFPDLSPDGQTIAFFHPTETAPIWGDIWIIPVGGGQPRQLTFDACEVGWPTWAPDGKSIVYSSTRGGSQTLWRVNVVGGTPTALTTGAGEDTEPDISSDGKKLIYGTQRKSKSLILLDPATGQEKEILSSRVRFAFPAFSPQGDRVAFNQASGAGTAQLHVSSLDGREVRQVTRGVREQNIVPQWSGDGAWLYYYQLFPVTSFRKISVEGGTSSEVAPLDFLKHKDAYVDSQDRAIVYTTVEAGTVKAIVRDLQSGKEHELGRPLAHPRWSTDSKTVFGNYTATDPGGDIWNRWIVAACPADGAACRTLGRGFTVVPSHDGSSLFFARDTGAARNMRELWMSSVDGSNPRKVATIGPLDPSGWGFDASRTNQIVYDRLNASRRELWLANLR